MACTSCVCTQCPTPSISSVLLPSVLQFSFQSSCLLLAPDIFKELTRLDTLDRTTTQQGHTRPHNKTLPTPQKDNFDHTTWQTRPHKQGILYRTTKHTRPHNKKHSTAQQETLNRTTKQTLPHNRTRATAKDKLDPTARYTRPQNKIHWTAQHDKLAAQQGTLINKAHSTAQ